MEDFDIIRKIKEGISTGGGDQKIELTNKLVDNLIGDDHPHIRDLKTTNLTIEDLSTWQLTLELLVTFFIEPYILDPRLKSIALFLVRKIYASRVSLNGEGRKDILKFGTNYYLNLDEERLRKVTAEQ